MGAVCRVANTRHSTIARAIACALRLAAHPNRVLPTFAHSRQDFEQALYVISPSRLIDSG